MRKIRMIILSVMFLIMGTMLWAQEDGHDREAIVIINEIKQEQGVRTISQIDPDQLSPAVLEELGDAVMGLMIVDEEQHEWMDEMMGGAGSEQLAATHRWIAYNYLQNDGNLGTWGPGMRRYGGMGPGMIGSWNRDWSNNFNSSINRWGYGSDNMLGWSRNWWIWIVVIPIILMSAVVAVVLFRFHRRGRDDSRDALEILRKRYAEGKISREEYQQMSKELRE